MGKCKECGAPTGEGYEYCMAHKDLFFKNNDIKDKSKGSDVAEILEKINWNMGAISKTLDLMLAYNVTVGRIKDGDLKSVKPIYDYVEKNIVKNIEIVKKIKEEQDKKDKKE